jgi:hypothetical protein
VLLLLYFFLSRSDDDASCLLFLFMLLLLQVVSPLPSLLLLTLRPGLSLLLFSLLSFGFLSLFTYSLASLRLLEAPFMLLSFRLLLSLLLLLLFTAPLFTFATDGAAFSSSGFTFDLSLLFCSLLLLETFWTFATTDSLLCILPLSLVLPSIVDDDRTSSV